MERFINLLLQENSFYLSYKQSQNIDFNSDENVIKFFKKIIFKNDVYVQLKSTLNLIFTTKKYCLSDDFVKKIVVQLVDVLNSNLEDRVKLFIFRCVFQAVASDNNQEEISVTLQFFILLSHILGINLLKGTTSEFDENPLTIKKKNSESAFEVQASPSSVSLYIFKELSISISKLHINYVSPENQPYFKWLDALVKVLAKAKPQQNIYVEILTATLDIEFSLLENNLEIIFTSIFQNKEDMTEDFLQIYSAFFEKTLSTFFKFQRFVKFVNRFLSAIQNFQDEVFQKNFIPPNVSLEFSRHVAMLSSQQSLTLMETLIQYLNYSYTEVSQHQKGIFLFEATSILSVLYFKELKIYSPNIPFTIFQSFINCFTKVKTILQDFKNFLINEINFLSKNKEILQFYLEVCLHFNEIQILVYCYKDTFSKFGSTLNNDYQKYCIYTDWDALVETFFSKKWSNLQPLFFQMAVQRLRSIKLENKSVSPEDSLSKIILSSFSSTSDHFDFFLYLTPEDMTLLMEFFSFQDSKIIISKFIDFITRENDENTEFFLSDSRLLESSNFIITLFSILIKKVSLIFKSDFNEKTTAFFDNEYFDDNKIYVDKVEKMSEKINYLLNNKHKIRKKFLKLKEHYFLLKIINIFKNLPLFYMEQPLKRLGLGFTVALTIIVSNSETFAVILLQKLYDYLNSDIDPSTCFHIGLCITWLGELRFEKSESNSLKIKVMEKLIRITPNTQFGLHQIDEFIDTHSNTSEKSISREILETQVTLYQELGKCWFRAKKRKSENDMIGNFRSKLAKIISEDSSELKSKAIDDENYKFLFKVFAIELHKAIREENEEFLKTIQQKFPLYFDFAVNKLLISYDDNCSSFLSVLLQYMTQIRMFMADDPLRRIWTVFKKYEKENWKLFAVNSTDSEFEYILSDLVQITEAYLSSTTDFLPNYFEIWISFLNVEVETKRNISQVQLQKLFRSIHDHDFFINNLSVGKKTILIKFFHHCLSNKKIILTTQMLDTIFDVTLHCSNNITLTNEDFYVLFSSRIEVAMSILLKQYTWNKNKVHLSFSLFQRMLNDLTKRSDVTLELNHDELSVLSNCALSMEKWVSAIVKKEKDFARITAYFITTIISTITEVTVVPAVKIHFNNCLNHLLSISDSHTIAYLLRVLKPGNQQLFTNIYDQFKKFHKYTGKV